MLYSGTDDEFFAALPKFPKRPVLCLGKPAGNGLALSNVDWMLYIDVIPRLAGFWDVKRYGPHAEFAVGFEWGEDDRAFYAVPDEHRVVMELGNLASMRHRGGVKVTCSPREFLARALERGEVDERYRWDEDPQSPWRACVRVVAEEILAERARIRAKIEEVFR